MIEHGTVKSVDSLPSATPANRHTSGISANERAYAEDARRMRN